MKNALTPYEWKGAKTLNSDLVVPMCPVCGGDRTSVAHTNRGELYCVDCNRIHLVLEPHWRGELSSKPAGDFPEEGPVPRAA
jgi:hypothetical protein